MNIKQICKFSNIYLVLWIILSVLKCNIVKGLGLIKSGIGSDSEVDKFPVIVETTYIEAIEGMKAVLTCPLIAPPSDKIYMVLWFRDEAGVPLYSIDARGKSLVQGQHWSDPKVFGTRAKFVVNEEPAYLEIREIKRHDQGIYRCRVDFKKSQTNSFKFNLTVIIPPEDPIVLDGWGRPLNSTTIGPKEEGDDVTLTCRVIGGRPQPDVRWLINGQLVDDQFEQNFGNVIENRLLSPSIKRSDLNSVFTCQAVNTHLVEPKEKHFILDMYLKPLTINITNTSLLLTADHKYEVLCETTGSRPDASMIWFKGKKQLKKSKETSHDNITISELVFVPTHEDDGTKLTCRAENSRVSSFFLETSIKLEVQYPPVVNLQLGATLSLKNIKEGEDVYFECHIKSNPRWKKLEWLHNGLPLVHNASAKVIRSNQSLVLQKVNKQSAGIYQCSAFNTEGETRSNQFVLRVKFAPLCKNDKTSVIGASKGELLLLSCDIHTDPEAKKFRWEFENSEEKIDIHINRFAFNGSTSFLQYTPIIEQDFGSLSCWATNEVGEQSEPCKFQIILAGPPSPVKNCTSFNETQQSITVHCQAGYDGGIPQIFLLEIISTRDRQIRFNATSIDEPKFVLNSLKFILLKSLKQQGISHTDNDDHVDYDDDLYEEDNDVLKIFVYAMNQKAKSEAVFVREFHIGNSKRNDLAGSHRLSPIILGTLATIIILIIGIILKFYLKFKEKKRKEQERYQKESKDSKCSLLNHNNETTSKTKFLAQSDHPKWQPQPLPSIRDNSRNSKLLIDFDFTTDDEKEEPDVISYPKFTTLQKPIPKVTPQNHQHNQPQPQLSISQTHNQIEELIPMTSTSHDLDVNIKGISDLLMSTRVPESCV